MADVHNRRYILDAEANNQLCGCGNCTRKFHPLYDDDELARDPITQICQMHARARLTSTVYAIAREGICIVCAPFSFFHPSPANELLRLRVGLEFKGFIRSKGCLLFDIRSYMYTYEKETRENVIIIESRREIEKYIYIPQLSVAQSTRNFRL